MRTEAHSDSAAFQWSKYVFTRLYSSFDVVKSKTAVRESSTCWVEKDPSVCTKATLGGLRVERDRAVKVVGLRRNVARTGLIYLVAP